MRDAPRLTYDDLLALFAPSTRERVGLELECGLLDTATGRNVGYGGTRGTRRFLTALAAELGGDLLTEAGALAAVQLPGGAQVSLELGSAIEYSSAPFDSLTALVAETRRDMTAVAEVARRLGLSVLPGALLPFSPSTRIPWSPKPRIPIMRDYFRRLGPAAASAERVMGLTLSTQTTVDFVSAADFREKLRLLVMVAPIAAAMFVNSPLDEGQPAGVLSQRMRMWGQVDPSRCGVLDFAVRPDVSTADAMRWALGLPMIYRRVGAATGASAAGAEEYTAAPDRTFDELMRHGFGDGTHPTADDWRSHLGQVWPHVRARDTLEMRAFDGLGWPAFAAAPAFTVGLVYHPPARTAALALLHDITAADLVRASDEVAAKGLDALVGRHSVGALVEALLRLACQGLHARVEAGLERPEVVRLLDPLHDVVRSGVTFAERCLRDWAGPFRERPTALVHAYRIP
ncbi:glutamate-cysteine ligase family protein [Actinomycetes bacterium KLBMP 9797]